MSISKITTKKIVQNLGFDALNAMQNKMVEASHIHSDIMLLAPTGSGKTVAYILSTLHKLTEKVGVQLLILAPTRELVLQIESVLRQMKLPVKINIAYGGHAFSIERKNFSTPPTILIGTPGRLQDHIERETFDTSGITQIIFDEFDKSLEFGFAPQMKFITEKLVNLKGKVLVSATKSIAIPEYIDAKNFYTVETKNESKGEMKLYQYKVAKDEKPEGLAYILNNLTEDENAIVFVNHRDACDRITELLGYGEGGCSVFHGGLKQEQRELELTKFRNGSTKILLATDIAARGIDIPKLSYVIHYQMPLKEDGFIHRNGRTARVQESGTAILIRTNKDSLPDYINSEPEPFTVIEQEQVTSPQWVTLYVGKGKKDKINKIDLVGYFLQFDFMKKEDVGLIEVKDFSAHIAVNRGKSAKLLKAVLKKKIKNKAVKIEIAR